MLLEDAIRQYDGVFTRFVRHLDGVEVTAIVHLTEDHTPYALMVVIGDEDRIDNPVTSVTQITKRLRLFKDYDPNNWQEAEY